MDTEPRDTLPTWRRGWTWTLIKCAMATLTFASAATAALYWLLLVLRDKLPGWIPDAWVRHLFEWVLGHTWFLGPILGILVGLVVSAGIIAVDAKRGKLTKLE